MHPLADPSCPLARIHWHLINDNSIIHQSNWPPLSETQQLATTGLTEASITNCVVWVSSNLLEDTTFFPHINHCENQIFGPLAGRTNTFFVRCQILFNIEGEFIIENGNQPQFDTEELCPLTYSPYESSLHTITERRAEYLMDLTSSTQKLLIKTGHLGGTYGETFRFSREGWHYFLSRLSNIDTTNSLITSTSNKDSKQRITMSNLTLQSMKLPTTKTEIRAIDAAGYTAIRKCLSLGVGAGIRKRHPRISTIGTPNNNLPVRNRDTVNLVDVDIAEYDDNQLEEWVPAHASVQRQPNFMKYTYDSRNREVRVVLRSTALIVGSCKEASFREFLIRNGIQREEDEDEIVFVGMMIEYDDSVFQVQRISEECNEVHMNELPQLGARTMTRTISWCITNQA